MSKRTLWPFVLGLLLGAIAGLTVANAVQSHFDRSRAALMFAAGSQLIDKGQTDAAQIQLAQTILVDPHMCSAYGSLADIYAATSKVEMAKQFYALASKCYNDDPHTLMDLNADEIQHEVTNIGLKLRRLESAGR